MKTDWFIEQRCEQKFVCSMLLVSRVFDNNDLLLAEKFVLDAIKRRGLCIREDFAGLSTEEDGCVDARHLRRLVE